ncbi:MAG: VCBS repeat-containing protein [Gammaproteobacteria bacterium]|nr:VCBS repeat-containing protein [Gammaproteobacteria bacterium]
MAGKSISFSGAVPDAGWHIDGWSGTENDASTANSNSLTMPTESHSASVNYVENPVGPTFYTDEFGFGDGWIDPTTPRKVADVNGDGKADIVGFSAAGAVVALGDGNSFAPGQLWEGSFGTTGGWDGTKHIRTMADVNGDGKADLVGFGDYGVLVSLSIGSGFSPLTYWSYGYGSEPAGGGWNTIDNNRVVADVNGDGKADIVGYGLYGVMVSLSNGSSFGTATYWTMGYGKLLGGWDGIQNPRMIADLNGDGCGDVVGFANYGVLVSLSNACGGSNTFGTPSYWAYGYAYLLGGWDSTKHIRTFGDVNNDGTDDLVGFGDSGVLVSPSNGSSLAAAATYWKMGYGYVNGGWRVDRHPRVVMDVNADDMADVVGFATDGVLVSTSNGSSFP